MQNRMQVILGFCLVIFLLGFRSPQSEMAEFKVGVLLCLTGECAEWGQNSLNGVRLAVDEINAEGGILGKKVKLVVQDTKEGSTGANSVSAYQALTIDKNVNYIIGPSWTIGGLPIAPIAAKNPNLIITSPSLGVADFNETADNIFNTWPHDSISTKALAKYAIDSGWKTAAVFSNQNPWENTQGRVFVEEFKKLGGEIKLLLEPLASQTNIKMEALKIKNANPDVVFFSNYTQMDIAAKELKGLRFTGNKLAILMDDTRINSAGGALEGTIFAMYPEAQADFITRFQAKFNNKPGITADTAYDTMKLYALAITQAKTFDTSSVKKILPNTQYSGASGKIVFDTKRGVIKSPIFWVVKDSKKVPL